MINNEKKNSRKVAPQDSSRMIETIFGCKWSLTLYRLLAEGVNRPGEMVRLTDGLSTKVLNTCLKRNIEFGILQRLSYNEVPPRVEYTVTNFGEKFISVVDAIKKLKADITDESASALNEHAKS